jgi:hypothetical protein
MRTSRQRGLTLLAADVGTAEAAAVNGLNRQFTQSQFDALVSIVFNCGGGILAASKTLGKALREPGMPRVPDAIKIYCHAGGKVLPGLVSRRNAEAAMWATATPQGPAGWLTASDLTAQRKRIWRSAQPRPRGDGHGWDHRSRRQRYESLRSRTTV